ncbi:DUF6542 domain-containing protein [Nocardia blacklockiae]|uniref:DUF6542 domain-containing protein n=1 Tax=Nocardia blacklockiae TaxID=480036 RepID=UPI0018935757|nr:DUF6542 domain-containing protein [Nocardia blacklockiae]MBF6174414.1 hypothetical protein [Nocardia blacklockiae]
MAATQRERSEVPASHRSIIPSVPGVPAGAAVLIAVACTFIGFFIDAGSSGKELTLTFATCYVLGCVLAALVVRYRGLFTTMVTPPLLLFVSVPLAYQQLLGRSSTSLKDVLLNLAIPLVNRFPTMAVATVLVLLIGGGRVLMHRQEAARTGGGDRPRKSTARTARSGRSGDRARRGRATGSSDTLRRRARSSAAAAEADPEPAPTRSSRRSSGRVAERPPRVSPAKNSYPRTSERAATADPAPRRSRTQRNGDVPPHPRPNVRYRDRDSGRIER